MIKLQTAVMTVKALKLIRKSLFRLFVLTDYIFTTIVFIDNCINNTYWHI